MKIETGVAATGLGAGLATGTVLGLPAAALLAGFSGGIVILALTPPSPQITWYARAASLTASTASAGFLGPYFAAIFHMREISPAVELFAFSFLMGVGAQILVPKAVAALGKRIDQIGGNA